MKKLMKLKKYLEVLLSNRAFTIIHKNISGHFIAPFQSESSISPMSVYINAAVAVWVRGERMQRSEHSRARPVSERGRETDGGWKWEGEWRERGLPVALLWPGVCL